MHDRFLNRYGSRTMNRACTFTKGRAAYTNRQDNPDFRLAASVHSWGRLEGLPAD